MLKLKTRGLLVLILGLLISCGQPEKIKISLLPVDVKVGDSLVYLTDQSTALSSEGLIFLYHRGKQLYLRVNKKDLLLDESASSQRHKWVSVSGSYIYVFWWEKYGSSLDEKPRDLNKTIYVRVSSDNGKTFSEKKIINTEAGRPLAKLSIAVDAKGNASIFYLDERFPVYQVFVNSTNDGGKTWTKDLMLNDDAVNSLASLEDAKNRRKTFAVSPNISNVGKELVAIWLEAGNEGGKYINRIFSRVSLDHGKTWGAEKEIYVDKENHSLQMKIFHKNKRLFLAITQAKKGMYVLYKEEGSRWSKPSVLVPGTDKAKSASYLRMNADSKYLYLTYIHIPPYGRKKDWSTVLQRYNLEKQIWDSVPHRLDAVLGVDKTRGGYQDITVLDDGTIMAVWEDFRYVLPVILMTYSSDQGENWSSPVVLSNERKHSVQKLPFIISSNNVAQVFFEYSDLTEGGVPYATTKTMKLVSPKHKDFKGMNLKEAKVISNESRKKELIKRFDDLMRARVSKDWSKAWGMVDPVYRNLYNKKSWISLRNRMQYKSYEILSVEVEGSLGKVSTIVSFDIGNTVQGVTANAAHLKNKRKSIEMPWGWFGDNWYLISEDPRTPYMP